MFEHTSSLGESAASPLAELLLNPALGVRRAAIVAGKALYEPVDPARHLYFIHRGQVRTYRLQQEGVGRLLDILGPGGWCGEAAFTGQANYGERAVAVTPVVVSDVPADRLMALLPQQPRWAGELIKQLAIKLRSARDDAAGLVFQDCQQRLVQTLIRFSNSAAASPQDNDVVLRITHHQLAQAVGVARETVSLALSALRRRNLLRTGRNRLIFNPDNLRSVNGGQRHVQEASVT